jgi:undecaprenyl-diphosphatase
VPSPTRLIDSAVLGRVSGASRSSARVARSLSWSSQWGLGWHALTALLVLRPGVTRRVGVAGTASWLVAQVVTAAVKPLVGRRRPRSAGTGPGVTSASMPSTHAASAAAYAIAALLQHRAASALLVPAGGVAWSRVRTRRHFVTDVAVGLVAGCAVGIAIGTIVRRLADRPTRGRRHRLLRTAESSGEPHAAGEPTPLTP